MCLAADSLSYVPNNGSTIADVQSCPANSRVLHPTLERGQMVLQTTDSASSIEQCLCEPGYYRGLVRCEPCDSTQIEDRLGVAASFALAGSVAAGRAMAAFTMGVVHPL